MISELILSGIIGILLFILIWEKRENKKETARFINALIARTSDQYRDLELTAKVKPIEPPIQKEPDLVPENEIPDKKFEDIIKEIIG